MTKEEAQQAWEKMRSEIHETNWLFVGTINPQMVDMAIEALSAERTGEWITEKGSYEIICSECGYEAFSKDGEWFKSDYCPTCGAKMIQKEKE